MVKKSLAPHQRQYWAWQLLRRAASDSVESLANTLVDAQVDLNPHQVEAALFACQNPLSKGVILADEVGLGKTIEAGLVISQRWAERRRRILIALASNPGDLVLDSFAGSGTTGAVAHKMGRRWIMVELGEHCHTHIIPRLTKVIDGQDPGGVTDAVGWKGGGGFRYYSLAPSLLERDRWGNWVVSREYDATMLAQALCKLEGFTYAPSEVHWWQHGSSSERDFICVTTQNLSVEQLQSLAEDVGGQRSLAVLCSAWRGVSAAAAAERWPQLTLKKIPKVVLARCEWGRDDYSLNVANLPMAQPDKPEPPAGRGARGRRGADRSDPDSQVGLFDSGDAT